MTALPNGWAKARLRDLGDPIKGSLQPSEHETFELYSVPSFADGSPEVLPGAAIGSHKRPVQPHDLLVCKINPRINRVWVVGAKTAHEQLASPEWLVLRSPVPAIASMLRYQLSAPEFRRWIERGVHGVTGSHTRAKDDHILDFVARVPPLAEQERIVAAIEEAFSKLDAGEAGLRTVRQLLKRMRDSILTAAVTGRLVPQDPTDTPAPKLLADLETESIEPPDGETTPDGWAWALLGSVTAIGGGIQKQPKRKPVRNSLPFLRVANVGRGRLDLSEVHEIEVFDGELDRYGLLDGDLLVVEGNGSPDQIGRSALWRAEIDPCVHQNHLIRVRPSAALMPSYLELYWNSPSAAQRVQAVASSTSGLHTLSTGKLKSLPVAIAPPEEQARIVAEVERQMSFVEACEHAVNAGLARSAALRRSVLKAAFEGRLVPQDPADEPASVLLDRVRAERAAQPTAKRRARRTA